MRITEYIYIYNKQYIGAIRFKRNNQFEKKFLKNMEVCDVLRNVIDNEKDLEEKQGNINH